MQDSETQKIFHKVECSVEKDWMEVAAEKQVEIAEQFAPLAGVHSDFIFLSFTGEVSVQDMVNAIRFQPLEKFQPLWRKNNRAHLSFLTENELAPDAYLWSLSSSSYCRFSGICINFFSLLLTLDVLMPPGSANGRLTVVVSGSYS